MDVQFHDQIKSIVVLRALKLGDMLCFIPTLRALRNAFPDAVISLVSLPVMEPLLRRYTHYFDEFIPFPGFPGMPEREAKPKDVVTFLSLIQNRKFDLALQIHGSGEVSNTLVTLFDAKRCSGFYREGFHCPDKELFVRYPETLSEVHRCLSILNPFAMGSSDDELEFPLHAEDNTQLLQAGIDLPPQSYVCIHPGASAESKRWSAIGFARIADYLIDRGRTVVFTGSAAEAPLVESIQDKMRGSSLDVASLNLPIGPLAALIKNSFGLLCNDTGVSHLAAALKVRSIVIFSETDPERWAPLNGSLHHWLYNPTEEELKDEVLRFLLGNFQYEEAQ